MSSSKRPTAFLDLDGTLVVHNYKVDFDNNDELLPGALDYLLSLKNNGYYLVLTTGRPEEACQGIIALLDREYNIRFDRFVFDLPTGIRVLVNDRESEDGPDKAIAVNVVRNKGW